MIHYSLNVLRLSGSDSQLATISVINILVDLLLLSKNISEQMSSQLCWWYLIFQIFIQIYLALTKYHTRSMYIVIHGRRQNITEIIAKISPSLILIQLLNWFVLILISSRYQSVYQKGILKLYYNMIWKSWFFCIGEKYNTFIP